MSAQLHDLPTMTEAEYLEFEETSEIRHEFVNGEIFAMTGASYRRNIILNYVSFLLTGQLLDKDCTVTTSDTRVKVDAKLSYRYPDIVIVCGKPKFHENRNDTIVNPTVIIEVLSPSTALIDRNQKFDEYIQIPDLEEYVLVSQDEYKVERFLRQDSGDWLYTQVKGLDGTIRLPSIGCQLTLSDVYAKLDLTDDIQDT